jgi:excisionase family DNA binding protein
MSPVHDSNGSSAPGQLLLTVEEAAKVLHIGRTTMYALIGEGALRPVHIGRTCRITVAELHRYVDGLESGAAAPASPASHAIPLASRRERRRTAANQDELFDQFHAPSGG